MSQPNKKFFSLLNAPERKSSPVGEPVYVWEFKNKKGEIIEDKINLNEKIQSYARQVDYKLRIKNNEEINENEGLYLDTTKLGDSYTDVSEYLSNLVASLRKDISQIEVQDKVGEVPVEGSKNPAESDQASQQGSGKTNEGGDQ